MSVRGINNSLVGDSPGVVRKGYLRKMKGSRTPKKFFVLRSETNDSSACLEYYDTERKFLTGHPPKRSIPLKTCFNINKRQDLKQKRKQHVIALYTRDDCFYLVLDTEEDLESWLKTLLSLQHGEETVDGEIPRPTFEHVWQVTVLNRGLGNLGLTGNYRLCLTDKTLSLIKKEFENPRIELNLSNIRSCGHLKNFFFLEVGRSSTLGAGEVWMDTFDSNIAQNVRSTVYHAMCTNNKEDMGPKTRNRSSSATESSKPNVVNRKQNIHSGMSKSHILSQDNSQSTETQAHPVSSSSSQHPIVSGVASIYQHLIHRGASKTAERRHSISAGGFSWSGNISHQRTQSLPLAHPAPFTDHTSHPPRTAKRSNQSSKCMTGGRERCDSMPTRPRTTSEGNHPFWPPCKTHLNRPSTFYPRDMSHSPPSGSPVSPPSVGCSTDSAGSSYSLTDETEINEMETTIGGRYSHSLTPDEAIAEEECPDSPVVPYGTSPNMNSYVPMAPQSSDDGYVEMSVHDRDVLTTMSPAASTCSVTSGTASTDLKYEYHLEKVCSYFTPSEEDETSSVERPARAYSVGSRPETYTKTLSNAQDSSRVRAMSVGSKIKKVSRVLPPHGIHAHPGAKSSSAPMLNSSKMQGSYSSIGQMDDLMEMDFTRTVNNNNNNSCYMEMKTPSRSNSGYVEMKPGLPNHESPYLDMRSGSSPAKQSFISPHQEEKTFVDLSKQYNISNENIRKDSINRGDYMDMDHHKSKGSTVIKPSSSPGNTGNAHFDYLDMNFQSKRSERTPSFSSTLSCSPIKSSISPKLHPGSPPLSSDYMDMQPNPLRATENLPPTPEGYVEMCLGKGHQRQYSLDSVLNSYKSQDDYTNMTLGSGKKKERKSSKKDKNRSQPITIQSTTSNLQIVKNSSSSSPLCSISRKSSMGTPPIFHLPLDSTTSPFSSLPRQKSRKNSRNDSKDSSSSSVTTPSGSSTIFSISLNSPCSPTKPPSKNETPVFIASTTSSTTIKVPPAVLNTVYKPSKFSSPSNTDDYTLMNYSGISPKTNKAKLDNYNSAISVSVKKPPDVDKLRLEEGDYAIMKPTSLTNKLVSTNLNCNKLTENSTMGFRPIAEEPKSTRLMRQFDKSPSENMNNSDPSTSTTTSECPYETLRSSECVSPVSKIPRPNSVNSDRLQNMSISDKSRPASVSCDGTNKVTVSRPSSASSELCSSSSTLVGSRPDSVNSDCMRPASVTSENQLYYASLDLAPSTEEEGSRSPRTLKSPNEISNQTQCEPDFIYAEIDFIKSEGLKQHNTALASNAKVKH